MKVTCSYGWVTGGGAAHSLRTTVVFTVLHSHRVVRKHLTASLADDKDASSCFSVTEEEEKFQKHEAHMRKLLLRFILSVRNLKGRRLQQTGRILFLCGYWFKMQNNTIFLHFFTLFVFPTKSVV